MRVPLLSPLTVAQLLIQQHEVMAIAFRAVSELLVFARCSCTRLTPEFVQQLKE